jgi:outer membrane lipoprotein-sorting protein
MINPIRAVGLAGCTALALCAAGPLRADDGADALLKQVDAATAAAQTLSADVNLEMKAGSQTMTGTGKAQLKKPNYALVTLALITPDKPLNMTIASDGTNLYNVGGMQVRKTAADASGKNIDATIAVPLTMFFDPQNLGITKRGSTAATLLPQQTIGGKTYDVVQFSGTSPARFTMKLFVGPEKLVTRMAMQIQQGPQWAHYTATLDNVKIGEPIADAAFAYTPPAAAAAGASAADPYDAKLIPVGKDAPNFTVPTPSGGQVTLAEASRGKKATVVNFWFYG